MVWSPPGAGCGYREREGERERERVGIVIVRSRRKLLRGMVPRMKQLILWMSVLVAAGCNQEHNKSIEVMNKGVEEGRQKLFDSAIRDLKAATTIDPSNAAAYYNLGVVY